MKYRAVIFDLDGTILNTLDDLASSTNHMLSEQGYPPRTLAEVRSFVGNGIGKLIERAVPKKLNEEEFKEYYKIFTDHYAKHCADNTKPYDGITGLVSALRSAGIKTAVVSNKADFAVKDLCEKYFPGLFDAVVGEREGVRRKPSPDSVNEVLHILGTEKEKAVYVGDSEVDIKTAKNAEIDAIIVDWGFRDADFLAENGAERVVSSVKELEKNLFLQ